MRSSFKRFFVSFQLCSRESSFDKLLSCCLILILIAIHCYTLHKIVLLFYTNAILHAASALIQNDQRFLKQASVSYIHIIDTCILYAYIMQMGAVPACM